MYMSSNFFVIDTVFSAYNEVFTVLPQPKRMSLFMSLHAIHWVNRSCEQSLESRCRKPYLEQDMIRIQTKNASFLLLVYDEFCRCDLMILTFAFFSIPGTHQIWKKMIKSQGISGLLLVRKFQSPEESCSCNSYDPFWKLLKVEPGSAAATIGCIRSTNHCSIYIWYVHYTLWQSCYVDIITFIV